MFDLYCLRFQELDTTLQVLGIDERGDGSSVRLTASQNASILPRSSRSRAMSRDLENIEAGLVHRLRYSSLYDRVNPGCHAAAALSDATLDVKSLIIFHCV